YRENTPAPIQVWLVSIFHRMPAAGAIIDFYHPWLIFKIAEILFVGKQAIIFYHGRGEAAYIKKRGDDGRSPISDTGAKRAHAAISCDKTLPRPIGMVSRRP